MKARLIKRFEDEIAILERELTHELPKEIKRARELGDLRENAEYHAAKERQRFVETRVSTWVATTCAVLALLLAAADLNPSQDLIAYLGLPSQATIGFGLWLSIVGAIVVGLISAYGAYALRDT